MRSIDYVITYVDDSDPNWVMAYLDFCQDNGYPIKVGSSRFRNPRTLRYHLRAIEEYFQFIRNVYLVVSDDSQVPRWINRDNVKIVYHKDIIPKKFLPTFNSNTIELFLHNIKGLSNDFIYANDDTYPNYYLDKNCFFDKDNGNIRIKINYLNLDKANKTFSSMLRNTQNLVFKDTHKEPLKDKVMKSDHSIKPLKKGILDYFWNKHKKELEESITPFRNKKNITIELCNFYYYLIGVYSEKFINCKYIEYDINNLDDIINSINSNQIQVLCINDVSKFKGNYEEFNKKLIETFEKKFPKYSRFENKI